MKTTEETLLETIAEVNHAEALSSVIKDALPSITPEEIVRNVDELYVCIGRIQEKCGDLQRSVSRQNDGSLVMPPPGFVAKG